MKGDGEMSEKKKSTNYVPPHLHDGDGPNLEFTTDPQRKLLIKNFGAGKDSSIDKLVLESYKIRN